LSGLTAVGSGGACCARSTPIWFRLWVDAEGLVHRAHLRAGGHFMEQRYFDVDAPIDIQPPTGG